MEEEGGESLIHLQTWTCDFDMFNINVWKRLY